MLAILLSIVIPLGLDLYLPAPESNPLTTAKIEVGRRLFFDRRLSRDGTISCATCHDPARAFSDDKPLAIRIDGRVGRRHAPALINRGYGRAFFWDGRETTLESQVLRPIQDPNEMDSDVDAAAARVGLARSAVSDALASFVRSILSGNSRFDRFINGERSAMTENEQRGLQIFRGKANCTSCHVGPTLTDERFHNTGIAAPSSERPGEPACALSHTGAMCGDLGRFLVTANDADRGAFKTPTLRDVALSGPYMHDGSLSTLEAVVDFYDQGGRVNANLDPDIRQLRLTDDEKRALAAFLRALTGDLKK